MQQTIVKTYKGKQQNATSEYMEDAGRMSKKGYSPISQVWTAGSYSFSSFLFALLLCLVFIGILVFIYMLIVKPAGTLTVTYALAQRADPEKVCPKCAERVKAAAAVCRFCSHPFESALSPPALIAAVTAPPVTGAEAFGRKLGGLFAGKTPRS